MKIAIESTGTITTIDGVPVRAWEGRTESGIACLVLVHQLVVRDGEDTEAFDRELRARLPPAELALPLHQVLDGWDGRDSPSR